MGHLLNIPLVLVLSMTILHISHAHDAGNTDDDFLCPHQCVRKVLALPPLTWDPELAKTAQAWADQRKDCNMIHSDRCGENMAAGPGLNGSYSVQMWLDERRYYDYTENKCNKEMCGHYTQIVWRDTKSVGCGRAQCDDGESYIIVCNYDPPGNIVGQKPY